MADLEPRGRDFGTGPGQFFKRYPEVINDLGSYNGSSLTVMNGAEGPFIRCLSQLLSVGLSTCLPLPTNLATLVSTMLRTTAKTLT